VAPVRYTTTPSPLGELLLTDHGAGLSGLYFPGHRRAPGVGDDWEHVPARFDDTVDRLHAYLDGHATDLEVEVDLHGTPGQREVWEALRSIPRGTTVTYGALAARLERPGSARAVAGAVARNPVSIVVPCHRVVGADGTLTGYAGGVERKRWLLALEGAIQPTLSPAPAAPGSS
jgi:methylated-DNA-[protein]-cysteine S-methyltransferase